MTHPPGARGTAQGGSGGGGEARPRPQGRDGKGRRGRKESTTAGPASAPAPADPHHPSRPHRRTESATPPKQAPGGRGARLTHMPVLDPNPQNGQRKLLLVFATFFAIFIVIGVIATILAP
ncbi:hypothetical protein GCM10010261_11390 [Streptomyces pilosus]|nr:hypothetical protein GCM10010261_11390 [Streptomyces pilosus]